MKEVLGEVIGLVGFAGFVVSVIAMIRPMPRFKLPTRGRAGLLMAASLALSLVGGSLLPPSTTATQASQSKSSSGPAAPPYDAAADVKTLFQQVRDETAACEEAGIAVRAAIDANRRVQSVYDALTHATETCKTASRRIADAKLPPAMHGEMKKAFKGALEQCRSSYYSKAAAYHSVASILDEGARPSQMAEARSALHDASLAQGECFAAFSTPAKAAGTSIEAPMTGTGDRRG